jgi:hypothetical protein
MVIPKGRHLCNTLSFVLQLADEKLYEHWRQNAPELRQVSNTIF